VTPDPNAPRHEISSHPSPQRSFRVEEGPSRAALETAPDPLPARDHSRIHLWLRRIGALLFVLACATTGVVLTIFPWRAEWTDNYFLFRYPELRAVVASPFFRGLCSGLGMLDIWIGFWEALHYDEDSPHKTEP